LKAEAQNALSQNGVPKLLEAVQNSNHQAAEALLSQGADLDKKTEASSFLLHEAATSNRSEHVQLLLANGALLNKVDDCRRSSLRVAANAGRNDAVLALLIWGASVNKRDDAGQILLHAAARAGSIAILRALLDVGASAACTDEDRTHMVIPAVTMKYRKCFSRSEALHCNKCSALARCCLKRRTEYSASILAQTHASKLLCISCFPICCRLRTAGRTSCRRASSALQALDPFRLNSGVLAPLLIPLTSMRIISVPFLPEQVILGAAHHYYRGSNDLAANYMSLSKTSECDGASGIGITLCLGTGAFFAMQANRQRPPWNAQRADDRIEC
jgi:hypothetical protein